jgi:NADPH:quinone reductase-like Zn-dependent oxidoreductase
MAAKSSSPINHASFMPAPRSLALTVGEAPYTPANPTSIVIRVRAAAINPVDYMIQSRGNFAFSHLKYPAIGGHDIAGEVVEVGSSVTRFKIGDRVAGFPRGTDSKVNDNAESGFQEYVVLQPRCTFPIPDRVSFESAAVIPLALLTSIAGLFESDQLAMEFPTSPPRPATGQAVIIWGGSTSVGCNAIQLAVSAGYEVYTTSSPKNFELMKRLGAKQVFDYKSPSVASEMVATIGTVPLAGALAVGDGGAEQCMTILSQAPNVTKKHVALATFPVSVEEPKPFGTLRTIAGVLGWLMVYKMRGIISGIGSAFVMSPEVVRSETGRHIFEDFVGKALREGTFVPAPDPQIVGEGHGLAAVQEGIDQQRKGVSAKKIVVKY